jgi:hypothetical protein
MKKTVIFCLFIFFLCSAKAQTQYRSDTTRKVYDKKTINKSELPSSIMDSYNRTNRTYPITNISVYPYYWDNQAQYYDFHTNSDTLKYTDRNYPIGPEYYELSYTKDNQMYKSVYAKDGTLMHTSRIIKDNELPKPVLEAIKVSEFRNWDIVGEKEKVDRHNPKLTLYRIKVRKGEETHILHYDQYGNKK